MSKIYKGYELIKAIADGEIKEGTKLLFTSTLAFAKIEVEVKKYPEGLVLYDKEAKKILPTSWLFNSTIELIEDGEDEEDEEDEIDIQNIKKVTTGDIANIDGMAAARIENKFNEIIRAIKKLDKKINK